MKQIKYFAIAFLLLAIILLPYIYAAGVAPDQYVFGGFLLNPLDGNSYLAKMRLGFDGVWQFTLQFSAQQSGGSYLFIFYIFLGHIARWLGLGLITTFHFVRVFASALLLFSLYRFFNWVFEGDDHKIFPAFLLASLGSGLGWIAMLAGTFTSDFWVAEAYPFLSIYSNPHFPLSLAILLETILLVFSDQPQKFGWVRMAIFGVLLGLILPFGVVLGAILIGGKVLIELWQTRKFRFDLLSVVFIAAGGITAGFLFVETGMDPILNQWNQQNITPMPPIWDFIISFSPAVILGLVGIYLHFRNKENSKRSWLLVFWLVGGVILAYLPVNLQRRFLMGYFIPAAGLAIWTLAEFAKNRFSFRLFVTLVILFSCLTNVIVLFAGMHGIQTTDPMLYLSVDERNALGWLSDQKPPGIILASPELGAFVPGWTGKRVVYGHPFETINALETQNAVKLFYSGTEDVQQSEYFLQNSSVRYIIYGDRERQLGNPGYLQQLPIVYQNQTVSIHQFSP